MKKLLIMLIAIALATAMVVGCDGTASQRIPGANIDYDLTQSGAYKMYAANIDAINAAGSFSGESTLISVSTLGNEGMEDISEDMDIDPFEFTVTTNLKYIHGSGDDFAVELINDEKSPLSTTYYYRNGTLYYNNGGQKVQAPYPGTDFLKSTNTAIATKILFPESDIDGYEYKEDGKGASVTFAVPSNLIRDDLIDFANYAMTGGLSSQKEELGWKFSDNAKVIVRVNKAGRVEDICVAFYSILDHLGGIVNTYTEIDVVVKQIGGVKIDYPTDLDSYVSIGDLLS